MSKQEEFEQKLQQKILLYLESDLYKKRLNEFEKILFIADTGNDDIFMDTEFLLCPASSNHHLNEFGGLVQHIINVYRELSKDGLNPIMKNVNIARLAIYHDLCKFGLYTPSYTIGYENNEIDPATGKRKKINGRVTHDVEKIVFKVEDNLPLGHGAKSVYLILKHGLKHSEEELVNIYWHMGDFDRFYNYSVKYIKNNLVEKFPSHFMLQAADMKASYLEELK